MDSRDLEWLLEVARSGSLSGAATARGVAVSTVARRLDALEHQLVLRLVDRRQNGARLTAAGARIAALAEAQVAGAARISLAAEALRQSTAREAVSVSATEFVISDVLAPRLPALSQSQSGVTVVLRSQQLVVSLAGREADIAIRMSRPEGNSLVARRLPDIELGLFASPGYLGGRDPATLDLGAERLLAYDESYGRTPEATLFDNAGHGHAIVMRTGSTRGMLNAAVAGAGIGLLPAVYARAAGLVQISKLPPRQPWLVVHRDLVRVPSIRAVRQWIVQAFRHALA